jgi:hypothetical protein
MTPEDARKLLGGYATGTLTDAEREALFAAALEDQELFDAMAREESLREALADPAARASLLAALDERPLVWWRFWKPAAALAMAGLASLAVYLGTRPPDVRLVATAEAPRIAPPELAASTAPSAPPFAEPAAPKPAPAPRRRFKTSSPAEERAAAAAPVALAEAPKPESLRADAAPPAALSDAAVSAPPSRDTSRQAFGASVAAPMQAGAVKEAKEQSALSARAMFLNVATPPARAMQAVRSESASQEAMGIRYSVQQDRSIRFTSNVNGYLSVAGQQPVALTARQPYATPPLPLESGEVTVVFSRRPQTSAPAATALTEVSGQETYVVNPRGAAFSFTIALPQR